MHLSNEQLSLLEELNSEEEKTQLRESFVMANRRRSIALVSLPITEDIGDVSTIGFVQDIRMDIESF